MSFGNTSKKITMPAKFLAKEAIADYKRAFVVDGAYGLLFKEWEEESKVQAQELKPKE